MRIFYYMIDILLLLKQLGYVEIGLNIYHRSKYEKPHSPWFNFNDEQSLDAL